MSTSFPGGVDTFTTKVDRGIVYHTDINNLQDAVVALETNLRPATTNIFNIASAEFGAVAGGSAATNATAIQAAITAARAAGGGTVLVPQGTFSYDTTLNINPSATNQDIKIQLVGAGMYASVLSYTGASYGLDISHTADGTQRGALVQNIGLTGTAASASGLRIKNVHETLLSNVAITGFGEHGILLDNAYVFTMWHTDVRSNGAKTGNYDGVNATAAYTHALHIGGMCNIGEHPRYGVNVTSGMNNVSIIGNNIDHNRVADVFIGGATAVSIIGNYFEQYQADYVGRADWLAINLDGQISGAAVIGNYILGSDVGGVYPDHGMKLNHVNGGEVSGNFVDLVVEGIHPIALCKDVHFGRNAKSAEVTNLYDLGDATSFIRVEPAPQSGLSYGLVPNPTAQIREWYLASSTATGVFDLVGDRIWNTTPSAGGAALYVCVTAGAPGTWKAVNCAP